MAGTVSHNRSALGKGDGASVVSGMVLSALGLLALAVAAIELYVSAGIVEPGAGSEEGVGGAFGLSTGTSAYVAGYTAAGVILVALGVWKMWRARRRS